MASITDNTSRSRSAVETIRFNPLTLWEAVTHVRDELVRGRGGRIIVVSPELLRQLDDVPGRRQALDEADLVLAGSATAVWASRIAGAPLPELITGPELADALCAAANADGRRVLLVGGATATAGLPSAAVRAAAVVGLRHPGLRVSGCVMPTAAVASDEDALDDIVADIAEDEPDLVLVGVDSSAAEEALVTAVRSQLHGGWIFGFAGLVDELVGDPGQRGGQGRRDGPGPGRGLRSRGGQRVQVMYATRLLARAARARVSGRRRRA